MLIIIIIVRPWHHQKSGYAPAEEANLSSAEMYEFIEGAALFPYYFASGGTMFNSL